MEEEEEEEEEQENEYDANNATAPLENIEPGTAD